jgi:hypothetical protein
MSFILCFLFFFYANALCEIDGLRLLRLSVFLSGPLSLYVCALRPPNPAIDLPACPLFCFWSREKLIFFLVSLKNFEKALPKKNFFSDVFHKLPFAGALDALIFFSELNKLPFPLLVETCFLCYSEIRKILFRLVDIPDESSFLLLSAELNKKKPWAIPIVASVFLFYFLHGD